MSQPQPQPQKAPYEGFWKRTMTLFQGLRVRVVLSDRTTAVVGNVMTVSDVAVTLLLLDGSSKLIELTDVREVTQVL